jgi:hypothetical protein
MSVGEQEMLKHALTQISDLKQIAPFTFEIKQDERHRDSYRASCNGLPLVRNCIHLLCGVDLQGCIQLLQLGPKATGTVGGGGVAAV